MIVPGLIFAPVTALFFSFAVVTAFFFSCFGPTLFLPREEAASAPQPRATKRAMVAFTFAKVRPGMRRDFKGASAMLGDSHRGGPQTSRTPNPAQAVAGSFTWVSLKLFPDGSRNEESIP